MDHCKLMLKRERCLPDVVNSFVCMLELVLLRFLQLFRKTRLLVRGMLAMTTVFIIRGLGKQGHTSTLGEKKRC